MEQVATIEDNDSNRCARSLICNRLPYFVVVSLKADRRPLLFGWLAGTVLAPGKRFARVSVKRAASEEREEEED